jgi:hypothetical protein
MGCRHTVDDRGVIRCLDGKHPRRSPWIEPAKGTGRVSTAAPSAARRPGPADDAALLVLTAIAARTAALVATVTAARVAANVAEVTRHVQTIRDAPRCTAATGRRSRLP